MKMATSIKVVSPTMRAVEISEYGGVEVLRLNPSAMRPQIGPDEILLRVEATSVNPIDAVRRMGYGRTIFKLRGAARMPIILGHDASGVVASVGAQVSNFKPGDAVWSAPDAFRNGTYAEFVAVRACEVARKPANLSHVEAASLPYVALTTWAALVGSGAVKPNAMSGRTVLVHAGAGGVGSFAIQLLKAWGARVVTTCSADNVGFCRDLGADVVVDYTKQKFERVLKDCDVVFDTLGYLAQAERASLSVLKRFAGAHYVAIVHPILPWLDRWGPLAGGLSVAGALAARKLSQGLLHGRRFDWAHFAPDGAALAQITELVEAGRIRANVQRVMGLGDVQEAHRLIETRRTRGKIVLRCAAS